MPMKCTCPRTHSSLYRCVDERVGTISLNTAAHRYADANMRVHLSPELEYFLTSGMASAFLMLPPARHHWWHRFTGCQCVDSREALTSILKRIREQMADDHSL